MEREPWHRSLLDQWERDLVEGRLSPFAALNGAFLLGAAANRKAHEFRTGPGVGQRSPVTAHKSKGGHRYTAEN